METSSKKPSICVMSLKRIDEIKQILVAKYGADNIDETMKEICERIQFDPNYRKGLYTKERGQKTVEYMRNKSKETGMTQYQLFKK